MTAYTFDKVKTIADDLPSGTITVIGQFSLTAALADTDTIGNIPVPKNAYITQVTVSSDELDTNASPTLVLDVGDSTDPNRFVDGAVQGAAFNTQEINVGTVSSGTIATGMGYRYTDDDNILITCDQNPATGATSGLVVVKVEYTMDAL